MRSCCRKREPGDLSDLLPMSRERPVSWTAGRSPQLETYQRGIKLPLQSRPKRFAGSQRTKSSTTSPPHSPASAHRRRIAFASLIPSRLARLRATQTALKGTNPGRCPLVEYRHVRRMRRS
jgi:hypothetical protein